MDAVPPPQSHPIIPEFDAPQPLASWESRVTIDRPDYFHELVAFLQALRSSVDFLVAAASFFVDGGECQSISDLLRWMDRGRKHPLLAIVGLHRAWLQHLQAYRDHLVHSATIVSQDVSVAGSGIQKGGPLPVVVPRQIDESPLDTRWSRVNRDSLESFARFEFRESYEVPGKPAVVRSRVEYRVPHSHVAIEEFMVEQLAAFDSFVSDLLAAFQELKFTPVRVGH